MAAILWDNADDLRNGMRNQTFTRTNSARYTAPELNDTNTAPTFKSDVWAFGMTLYHVLTDTKPYYAENFKSNNQVSIAISRGILPFRPVKPNRWITDDVWELFLDCSRMNPEERPDMQEVYERLVKIEQTSLADGTAQIVASETLES